MEKLSKEQALLLLIEAENIQASLDAVKPLYARLDEITQKLIGQDLSWSSFSVVDNFAVKNTCYRMAAVKRFELKKIA
jgi:hypothetical protein